MNRWEIQLRGKPPLVVFYLQIQVLILETITSYPETKQKKGRKYFTHGLVQTTSHCNGGLFTNGNFSE